MGLLKNGEADDIISPGARSLPVYGPHCLGIHKKDATATALKDTYSAYPLTRLSSDEHTRTLAKSQAGLLYMGRNAYSPERERMGEEVRGWAGRLKKRDGVVCSSNYLDVSDQTRDPLGPCPSVSTGAARETEGSKECHLKTTHWKNPWGPSSCDIL